MKNKPLVMTMFTKVKSPVNPNIVGYSCSITRIQSAKRLLKAKLWGFYKQGFVVEWEDMIKIIDACFVISDGKEE